MPVYGISQAGSNADATKNLTSLSPGDKFTLFDGTETPVSGLRSVAFSRGCNPGGGTAPTSFTASGMASDMRIDITSANDNVAADYVVQITLAPDANGNASYTDQGNSEFWSGVLSTYSSGAMPILKAQR